MSRIWADKRQQKMQQWAYRLCAGKITPTHDRCRICRRKSGYMVEHHPSYYRPFFTVRLCSSCHGLLHGWIVAADRAKLGIPYFSGGAPVAVSASSHRELKIHCTEADILMGDAATLAVTEYLDRNETTEDEEW